MMPFRHDPQALPRLPFSLAIAIAAIGLILMTPTAQAEITLVDGAGRAIPGQNFAAELRYDATKRLALIERLAGSDFLFFEGERFERPGQRPNALVESALLATPGVEHFDPAQWRVAARVESFVDGTPVRGANASGAITLEPIRMGTIAGIAVRVDPDRVRDGNGDLRRARIIDLSIAGPPANYRSVPTLSAKDSESSARVIRSTFLNGHSVQKLPARDPRQTVRSGPTLPEPPGDFRITYRDGNRLMRIPAAELGATLSQVDEVSMSHHGEVLPVLGAIEEDFWFYAPRRVTRVDKSDSVFASVAPSKPLAAQTREAFETLSAQGTEVALERSRHYDDNLYYERLLSTESERFVYYRTQSGQTKVLELAVADLLTTTALTLGVQVYGYNASAVNPDHFADFAVEGVAAPRTSWEGRTLHAASFDLDLAGIPTPGTLTFEHAIDAASPFGSGIDIQNLEAIDLHWTGYPRAENGQWGVLDLPEATDNQPRRVSMGGFPAGSLSSDIIVLDVTVTSSPIRLLNIPTFTDSSGGVAVEFEAPPSATVFHIEHIDAITTPLLLTSAETMPDDLPGTTTVLKTIIVRPEMFEGALAPLIAHRGADNIIELNPQAAYNAYNGGQESPEAIRDAVRDLILRHDYRLPLVNVFLVGHASLDPRDYLGTQVEPQVPCFIEYGVTSSVGVLENSIDYPYSLLFGEDDIPDAILGRWPARTVADVQRAVARNLRHDEILPDLRAQNRPGFFICDNEEQFRPDQDMWQQRWEQSGFPTLRMDNFSTMTLVEARAEVVAGLTAPGGVTYAQYIGHGNLDLWSDQLMTVSGLNAVHMIDTTDQWPIMGVYTCLNGYYAFPGSATLSLAEAWLFASDYGAMASIAPCGVDFYFEQRLFALTVIDIWGQPDSTRPRTIGETMTAAQINYATWYPFFKRTNHEYLLFGDPQTNTAMDPPIISGVEEWRLW